MASKEILFDVRGFELSSNPEPTTESLVGQFKLSELRAVLAEIGLSVVTSTRFTLEDEQLKQEGFVKMLLLDPDLAFAGYLLCRELPSDPEVE